MSQFYMVVTESGMKQIHPANAVRISRNHRGTYIVPIGNSEGVYVVKKISVVDDARKALQWLTGEEKMIHEKPDILTVVIIPGEYNCGWQLQWHNSGNVVSFGTAGNPQTALEEALKKRSAFFSAKAKGT